MANWKLTLSYDGTPYCGWQIQPNLPTIQGLLSDAIHRTVGERVLPQGSGRTDAGVHALAQVASFSLTAPIPAANLHRALNRCLPPSVRVLSVELASEAFHARHSAIGKTYEYRIFPLGSRSSNRGSDPICPPTLAPFVWPCPWPLDLDAMNQAAAHVIGTHDFTTFAASDPDLTSRKSMPAGESSSPQPHESSLGGSSSPQPPESSFGESSSPQPTESSLGGSRGLQPPESAKSTMGALAPGRLPTAESNLRTITHSHWHIADGLFLYRVTANGFLHHMVRNLAGTFVQAGAHRLDPASIPALLAARNRSIAGPTAPATGLFLLSVEYPAIH